MQEKQLRVTIIDEFGREFKTTYRETNPVAAPVKDWYTITMATKIGDVVTWHENDFYMTKRTGKVTGAVPLIWDYSKPVGQRAEFI